MGTSFDNQTQYSRTEPIPEDYDAKMHHLYHVDGEIVASSCITI